MAPFDECCVLIPSATLEDFPANASDFDACSLLAAWTVLWHPRLLAQTEQLPTWYRADSPPDVDGPRVVVVPTLSVDQLPGGYESKCRKNSDCRWITGNTRDEMLEALGLESLPALTVGNRTVGVPDFFAAGYTHLQIQVMTRRLRYTSNLDEIHLQGRVIAAAKAWIEGNAKVAMDALHDVFDCLAEERDHYFSSDPHLVDLTLLTPSTLDPFLQHDLPRLRDRAGTTGDREPDSQSDESVESVQATPGNVLVDYQVANVLADSAGERYQSLRESICQGAIGWAGGDPNPAVCLDAMTYQQAYQAFSDGKKLATDAIGSAPRVYSRYRGATPADFTPTLVGLGYEGMIPMDFSRGVEFGDESKIIRQGGGAEIQALTAKPIDAGSDASFLNLGARLGESIDSGEIATALLVHWPGGGCESFHDLQRAASWSLALGRFWKLDDYFVDGEHPYHHGSARSICTESSSHLTQRVEAKQDNPISGPATEFRDLVIREVADILNGMIGLVTGHPGPGERDLALLGASFAKASGASPDSGPPWATLCVNPNGSGRRDLLHLNGHPPARREHIYAATADRSGAAVSIDVPAFGFALASSGETPRRKGALWGRLFSHSKQVATGNVLANEFMEALISPKTGGIQAVHSGQVRGNRFSLRLVEVAVQDDEGASADDGSSMVADRVRVVSSNESVGEIEATGKVVDSAGNQVASFALVYRLERGSRQIQVSGNLRPTRPLKGNPWGNYLGIRVAFASEAAIVRLLVRDKVHRSRSRRMIAPLGVVIDEAERQTLISSAGLAHHRRVGDRFVDTLLAVEGETAEAFNLSYGFDISNPVAVSKAVITGPLHPSVEPNSSLPSRGWILFASPAEVLITQLQCVQRDDGRWTAIIRAIQTRAKSASVTLRFCRDVQMATILDGVVDDPVNVSLHSSDDEPSPQSGIRCQGDSVRFAVAGHQVTDLLVVFDDP